MQKLLQFFRPLITFNYKYPYWVLGITTVLAVVLGSFALELTVDTDLANLLPEQNPHVKSLEKLQQTVGGETTMTVAIKSPSFEDNKAFARDLIDRTLAMHDDKRDAPFFERASFRKETSFLENNALYFATNRELDDIKTYLKDEIQKAKKDANPFLVELDEDEKSASKDESMSGFEESYNALIPSEYAISPDSTVMLVEFYPTGSKSNLSYLRRMFDSYDSLLDEVNPKSYNKAMKVEYGGRLKRHLSEIDSIMSDVLKSFTSGITGIILLVMLYFSFKKYFNYRSSSNDDENSFWIHLIRLPVPALVIGIPLLISLAWTFGIAYFVLGSLNTMTSVLFVILFGMGIDYGIHFYARYVEFRAEGTSILEAFYKTYDNTGSAILVSGFTTAFSLFVLILAQFRGFSEFGFIAGSGIILALLCMLYIMPSVLLIFERFNWIKFNEREVISNDKSKSLFNRFPMARSMVVLGLVISVVVGMNYQKLDFQYDFGELEPDFPEYEKFNKMENQVSQSDKRNPAYILADNQQQVIDIVDKIRHKMKTGNAPTVLEVEALPERFPTSQKATENKLQEVDQVRSLLNDPFLKDQDDPQLKKLRKAAQTRQKLNVDQIPDYFKNQFLNKQGEVGNFVIVYPSVGLSDGEKSIAFKNDIGEITLESGETFHAASTSIIAAEMLELMRSESPWMVAATFAMVFLLMLVAFRSLKWTLIAMLPLTVGLLCLFGIMMIFGMMFNFYNLVVLPAILGIGEDNGVHLASRYREEGSNSVWQVLSSTGQHVTIGSLTTMIGFSGLLFTNHPGLQSIGHIAIIGIGMTLVTGLTFLPALIQWLEDRDWIHF